MVSVLKSAADTAHLKDELRDRMCNKGPGTPEQYRLRVSATCVATSGAAKLASDAKRRKANTVVLIPSVTATRSEIARIERELRVAYPNPRARYDAPLADGGILSVSFLVLEKMLAPAERMKTPDPLERYNRLVDQIVTHGRFSRIDPGTIQRHTVLRATLHHLRALLAQTGAGKRVEKSRSQ
jgi:hypothetical protein